MLTRLFITFLFISVTIVNAQDAYYTDTLQQSDYIKYEKEINKSNDIIKLIKNNEQKSVLNNYGIEDDVELRKVLKKNFKWARILLKAENSDTMIITITKLSNLESQEITNQSVNVYYSFPNSKYKCNDILGIIHYSNRITFEFFKAKDHYRISNLLESLSP